MSAVESGSKPRIYTSAFICESVIQEGESHLVTAVRIASAYQANPITFVPHLPDGTLDKEHTEYFYQPAVFSTVVIFYSEQPVDFVAEIKTFLPSGKEAANSSGPIPCHVGGGALSHALNIKGRIAPNEEGTYWIEIHVDGKLETKVPVHITHAPIVDALQAADQQSERSMDQHDASGR